MEAEEIVATSGSKIKSQRWADFFFDLAFVILPVLGPRCEFQALPFSLMRKETD